MAIDATKFTVGIDALTLWVGPVVYTMATTATTTSTTASATTSTAMPVPAPSTMLNSKGTLFRFGAGTSRREFVQVSSHHLKELAQIPRRLIQVCNHVPEFRRQAINQLGDDEGSRVGALNAKGIDGGSDGGAVDRKVVGRADALVAKSLRGLGNVVTSGLKEEGAHLFEPGAQDDALA